MALAKFLLVYGSIKYMTAQGNTSVRIPFSWPFKNVLGPDGPWSALSIGVGSPVVSVDVYPGQIEATFLSFCEFRYVTCPASGSTYSQVGADAVPGWNDNLTDPLRLNGSMAHTVERITLDRDPGGDLDNISFLIAEEMTTSYGHGINTSLEAGILSLAAQQTDFEDSTESSGKTYTPLEFLASSSATDGNPIPSLSWGLHIASAQYNVTGSLIFGGYDQARVLQEPGVFDSAAISLTDIHINSTISAFQSTGNLMNTSNTPFSTGNSIPVLLEPAVPYLYLPPAVCNSLATYLPLTYNPSLDLFIWKTSHPSLMQFLTSLSNLEFTFTNNSGISTIIVIPFALLNLTLSAPLVSKPTSYFPCRPYSNDEAGIIDSGTFQYYLGRAFLQGAFIGQNWGTGSYFLAQAPGPVLPSSRVVNVEANDTSVSALAHAPKWEDTWENYLSRDGLNRTTVPSCSSPAASQLCLYWEDITYTYPSKKGLSRRSIAGISISLVVLSLAVTIAVTIWFRKFKIQRRSSSKPRIWDWVPWSKPELGAHERIVRETDGTASVSLRELGAEGGIIIAEVEGDWAPCEVRGDIGTDEMVIRRGQRSSGATQDRVD